MLPLSILCRNEEKKMRCKVCNRKIGPGCKILVTEFGRFFFCCMEHMEKFATENRISFVFNGRIDW